MATRSIIFVAILVGLVSAQETTLCSRTGDRMTFFKEANQLKCGTGITFPSFKVAEDGDGLSVIGVNVASIDKAADENCNFYAPQPGVGIMSLRDGRAAEGLTWVPEEQPSDDGGKFTGPINNDHKKWGTVVMNGCSIIIQRVGTDFYISHPLNGFSIRKEVTGTEGATPVGGGQTSAPNKVGKRAVITPIPMVFNKDGSKNADVTRNTHVVGEWNNGNLVIYLGQFRNDMSKLPKDKVFKEVGLEGYLKTTNGPSLTKLTNLKAPLVYDNCYKIVVSGNPSVEAEDAPPTNMRPKKGGQQGAKKGQQGAKKQAPKEGQRGFFLEMQNRISMRKRV